MGSRLKSKYENLTAALNESDWDEMSGKERKNLQLIILMTQIMKGFNGIFMAVSFETFQTVNLI